jgi:hypothetical protein
MARTQPVKALPSLESYIRCLRISSPNIRIEISRNVTNNRARYKRTPLRSYWVEVSPRRSSSWHRRGCAAQWAGEQGRPGLQDQQGTAHVGYLVDRRRAKALDTSRRGSRRHHYPTRGHHPYVDTDCCRLRQTTNRAACNRARESTTRASPRAWSPGVHVESRRPKVAPWRPPESTPPLAKSFVLRQTVCK